MINAVSTVSVFYGDIVGPCFFPHSSELGPERKAFPVLAVVRAGPGQEESNWKAETAGVD